MTKAETQLDFLRTAVDALCEVGNMESKEKVTAVSTRLLRAITPIRQLEELLVREIQKERLDKHVRSEEPTPGLAVR